MTDGYASNYGTVQGTHFPALLNPVAAYATQGYAGFAVAALIGSGTFAASFVILALWTAVISDIEVLSQGQALVSLGVYALYGFCAIAGYVTLGIWMKKTKSIVNALGDAVPETWKIWVSWLIPVYAFFGPYRAMALLSRRAHLRYALATWWTLWLLATVLSNGADTITSNPNAVLGLSMTSAGMFIGSYVALTVVIRKVTQAVAAAAHVPNSAATFEHSAPTSFGGLEDMPPEPNL